MAPKRKNGDTGLGEPTHREKKKQKVEFARAIAVQHIGSEAPSGNAVAGPSNPVATNSLKGLPSTIDVEKFTEARAFEIDAMRSAMKSASAASTQRAWQALPRHLRRRAASHDVRRVPSRLREKAQAEMDPVRKKPSSRSMPKRGKHNQISRTESFLKRQRDKSWLETHIWHAKRMRMENMWGYRLAVHPTEKAYRPSIRASNHGSILHDASYYALIELKGPEHNLIQILERCCDPQGPGPGSKRYLGGTRTLETHIYKPAAYPFSHIAPITIIWNPPVATTPPSHKSSQDLSAEPPKDDTQQNVSKQKQKSVSSTSVVQSESTLRRVWLRFHPIAYADVLDALKSATSNTLSKILSDGRETIDVEIADLRGQVNAFEIMGPKASQVLKGAFTPHSQEKREEFRKFWSSLGDLQTSASLPRGMIIGLTVNDPRLSFPPKNAKANTSSAPPAPVTTFPSLSLATSDIWDEAVRNGLSKPRFKKKDLDERRAKNLIPGTRLNPQRQDDRVPALLIQHSVEQSVAMSDSNSVHGWTLIIPAGWAMAFWDSLTFTGTRVGGQRERQTQAYESGTAYFPRDFPFTNAYDEYATKLELQLRETWGKKPPAKRTNFEKLGTRNPWRADWNVVLGLAPASAPDLETTDSGDFVTTQREPVVESELNKIKDIQPWLLRGPVIMDVVSNISKVFNHGAALYSEVNRLRLKRGYDPLGAEVKAADLFMGALVPVQVKMCSRGVPEDLAIIYSMPDEEAKRWEKALHNSHKTVISLDGDSYSEEIKALESTWSNEAIIGYITTGHESFSRGQGFGIGAIPLVRMLELQEQIARWSSSKNTAPLVKIRNINGCVCRAARIEILPG